MRTGLWVTSLVLGGAAIVAFVMALINMNSLSGEVYSDVGNGAMLTACFLSLTALHLRRSQD